MTRRFGHPWLHLLLRKPLGVLGGTVVVMVAVVALAAPVLSPFDPYVSQTDVRFGPPTKHMLLGGDQIGRDVLSRLIYGARISLYVAGMSVGVGVALGALAGILSAFLGGRFDLVFQRVVDALMPFPPIILGLAMMAVLGSSINNVIVTLVVVLFPGAARTMRAQTLSILAMDYIRAAEAIGGSSMRIVLRHVIPNIVATLIVLCSMTVGYAIVAETSLSFLGVGAPPDVPSWGSMASAAAQEYLGRASWLIFCPGIAIAITVFGFNVFGDALSDALDPKS